MKTERDGDVNLKVDEATTQDTVGQLLKNARTVQDLSLEDVSKALCITKSFLVQLEETSESLPIDVYTLGFIRAYSKLLNLNSDELIQRFKESNAAASSESTLIFPKPLPRRGIPRMKIVSISLLGAILLVMGWETMTSIKSGDTPSLDVKKLAMEEKDLNLPVSPPIVADEDRLVRVSAVEPVSEVSLPQALTFTEVPHEIASPETPSTPPQASTVTMTFTEETWVQVKGFGGEIVMNRTFSPGERYTFEDPQGYVLKTGNAGGLRLNVGDRELPSLGYSGEVRGNISLATEKLLDQLQETP